MTQYAIFNALIEESMAEDSHIIPNGQASNPAEAIQKKSKVLLDSKDPVDSSSYSSLSPTTNISTKSTSSSTIHESGTDTFTSSPTSSLSSRSAREHHRGKAKKGSKYRQKTSTKKPYRNQPNIMKAIAVRNGPRSVQINLK